MSHWMKRAVAAVIGVCVAASLLVVATDGVSQAGEDKTLCRAAGADRVAIPATFVIDACFDGVNLVLRNRKEIVLRVTRSGSPQRGVLNPVGGVPTVAAGLIKAAHSSSDPDLLPPNYELRIPVTSAAGSIELFGVKTYQQQYVLMKGFITAFGLEGSLVGTAQSFIELNQSLLSNWSDFQRCGKAARGYFGRFGCDANYTRGVAVALVRFTSSFVDKVQVNKAKFSVEGVRNILNTAEWVNAAVGDFAGFISGDRRLQIAASGSGPESPEPPASGGGVGPAPVLSQRSGPAGRSVSFTADRCPAVPSGKAQELQAWVLQSSGSHEYGGHGVVQTRSDGTVDDEGSGRPIFTMDTGAPQGEYRVKLQCVVFPNAKDRFQGDLVKTYGSAMFRVTGPSPRLRLSATTAKVGDTISVTPTVGCPTGTAEPSPFAAIYTDNQSGERFGHLERDNPEVKLDGSWTQKFRVQKGAVPGRYVVTASCSHINAGTPGQEYSNDGLVLTVVPEQATGSAASARAGQPVPTRSPTPRRESAEMAAGSSVPRTTPEVAPTAARSLPRSPRPGTTAPSGLEAGR